MKTSVMEVHDMLSVLSVEDVEQRIGEVPGVDSVTVNFAAGSATVRYDETRLEVADIKSAVRQSAYEPSAPGADVKGERHEGHAGPSASPAVAAPITPPVAAAPDAPKAAPAPVPAPPAGDAQKEKITPTNTDPGEHS